jgi:hypothetical protein
MAVFAALALSIAANPAAAAEPADSRTRIEIAAGPAGQALKQFVAQTGLQLLFDFEAVNGLMTRSVSGQLDAAEALKRMLAGTGLAFQFVNDRTVTVTLQGRGGDLAGRPERAERLSAPPGIAISQCGPRRHRLQPLRRSAPATLFGLHTQVVPVSR